MDLDLDEDQQAVAEVYGALFAKLSSPDRVRAAEATGFDAELWGRLVDTGAPTLAVPSDVGGAGGALLDLALVAEARGRHVGSVPLIECAVAARLLAANERGQAVAAVASGESIATLALHPAVDGVARLVPAGAVADLVIALDGEELVAVPGGPGRAAHSTAGSRSLGAETVADRVLRGDGMGRRDVLATGAAARRSWERAVDEWKTLTAASLAGLASAALVLAVDYVRERRQFGAPIGSFQSVAHRLVDAATEVEGARLVAFETAWIADHEPERLPGAAASAFALAAEVAQRRPRWACTSTAATASCSSTTCSCTSAGPRRGPSPSATPKRST